MTKSDFKQKIYLLVTFAVLFCFIYFLVSYYMVVDSGNKITTIVIKPGDSFNRVAAKLLEEKVIESRFVIKVMARLKGIDKKLIPGRYDFVGENSVKSVLERLRDGDFLRIKLTIPEGNTIWETAAVVAEKLELDSAVFHNLNSDTTFLDELDLPYLEGYFYPETYFLPWGMSEKDVAREMVTMFHTQTDTIWSSTAPNNLDKHEVVIMASIIEAETGLVDERRMVSSVYHNRLTRKMKLDADPTVIYGLGGLDRPLYRKDLRQDTPYNTYTRKGLPPTPINSPGLAAIRAAIHPEESDYLFFVADNTGRHYFSRTNAEHNRAIRRIRSGN